MAAVPCECCDGKLSPAEFTEGRDPAEAREWFTRRNGDRDGFVSRKEFLAAIRGGAPGS